ncbi:MAG: hypothetical protein PHF86_15250 [Candidatus Nanoarchaeia archaeon]|nr:hypothetical protein [Candidatus Nanoarchaeia archaeon]
MSEVIGDTFIIQTEESQQCDFCGEVKELRPYGPNGECICFECAMKDEKTTKEQFNKIISNVKNLKIKI